ncbi:C-GCAxxG-C-C family (seleno)protein [Aedoeadaptatus coxii]|uniref:C-GCAxxG-C-C family (seleno)protein n=1 Tax=Aedoeadaptatus coxii TaxID=755172 RepID=UPI002AD525DA|nr:C-GCAxxG-C-C family (seleno)protein [Peptoniphilus coxii]
MNTKVDMEKVKAYADEAFHSGYACSETVIDTFRKSLDLDIPDEAIAMSSGFPWGLGGGGCICGALAGATMCLGYLYGRTEKGDPKINRCFELSKKMHDSFREKNGATCCRALTHGYDNDDPHRKCKCAGIVENTMEDLMTIVEEAEKENK